MLPPQSVSAQCVARANADNSVFARLPERGCVLVALAYTAFLQEDRASEHYAADDQFVDVEVREHGCDYEIAADAQEHLKQLL